MKTLFVFFAIFAILAFGTSVAAGVLYEKKNKDAKHHKAYVIVSCVAIGLIAVAAILGVNLGIDIFK